MHTPSALVVSPVGPCPVVDFIFAGVRLALPEPDDDGTFTYVDPFIGEEIAVASDHEAAVIEWVLDVASLGRPFPERFARELARCYPALHARIGYLL